MCSPSDFVKSGVDSNYTPKEKSHLKIEWLLINKEAGTYLILNTQTYMYTYFYPYMELTIRSHFLHISKVIKTGQCMLDCPHYVELNVKIIFVKYHFCEIPWHISELEKIESLLLIWLILFGWSSFGDSDKNGCKWDQTPSHQPPATHHLPRRLPDVGWQSGRNLDQATQPLTPDRKVSQMHSGAGK